MKKTGGPEVLVAGEAPDPVAGPGQVLIEVELANITFVETQLRAGSAPFALELPAIPGNGVGGTVAAIGPGVDQELAGRRVVSSMGGSGGYAERAVVDAAGVIAVPDGLGLDVALALLADGRTAVSLVRAAAPQVGERVLVEAAAGGVGSLLVQLSAAQGAEVVAAAGGARKLELARELGRTRGGRLPRAGLGLSASARRAARSTSFSTGSAATSRGPHSGCSQPAGGW